MTNSEFFSSHQQLAIREGGIMGRETGHEVKKGCTFGVIFVNIDQEWIYLLFLRKDSVRQMRTLSLQVSKHFQTRITIISSHNSTISDQISRSLLHKASMATTCSRPPPLHLGPRSKHPKRGTSHSSHIRSPTLDQKDLDQ